MFYPQPQTPYTVSIAKTGTLLGIVPNLVCKSDMRGVYCKILCQILLNKCQRPAQDNQCPDRQATIGHPFQLDIYIWITLPHLLHIKIQIIYDCKIYVGIKLKHRLNGGNTSSSQHATTPIPRPVSCAIDEICAGTLGVNHFPSSLLW